MIIGQRHSFNDRGDHFTFSQVFGLIDVNETGDDFFAPGAKFGFWVVLTVFLGKFKTNTEMHHLPNHPFVLNGVMVEP